MILFRRRQIRQIIKKTLYFLLYYSGMLRLSILVLTKFRMRHCAVILFYHRFAASCTDNYLLPQLHVREFMKQMHHIKKWYDVITIDELSKRLVRKERFHKPSVIITIDDGYLNNYTIAYPILKELNLPAIIYLTAGCIGTNKGLWIDDIEYALIHAKVNTFSFEELFGEKVFDISTLAGKKETEKTLYSTIHRLENLKRAALIKKLFENLHVDISELKIKPRIMLNWEEIREMSNNGVEFGAHTVTHPFLPALPLEDGKNEIKRSKALVEEKVGKTIKHFAVPNGTKKDFTPALKEYCAAIGFDSVVMTESGVVMSHADRYELSRTIPPPPLYYFACEVAKYFFYKRSKHIS